MLGILSARGPPRVRRGIENENAAPGPFPAVLTVAAVPLSEYACGTVPAMKNQFARAISSDRRQMRSRRPG